MQNQDKHPAHVRSTRQRYDKIRNYAPLACGKKWLYLENEWTHKLVKAGWRS